MNEPIFRKPRLRMTADCVYVNVKTAFLAMTEFVWEILSQSDFDFQALLDSLRPPSGGARRSLSWPVWVRSVQTVTDGRKLRSTFGAWATSEVESYKPALRSYDFSSEDEISLEDGYLAMQAYLEIFQGTAGADSLTLIGDTEIEADGGPFDAAAWDDWLAAVQRVTAK